MLYSLRLKINVFLRNILVIKEFLKNKRKLKLLYFEIPNEIAYSYIRFDSIQTVSNLISNVQKYNIKELDSLVESKNVYEWPDDILDLKLLLKLGWLINDIREHGNLTLYQLIKGKDHYYVHPGTTRYLISTYILPEKYLKGIYVWDQDIDPEPFILGYKHKELSSLLDIIKLCNFNYPSRFRYMILTNETNCQDIEDSSVLSNRPFLFAQENFSTISEKFEIPFLTFHNSTHWHKINKKILFSEIIKFTSDTECLLSNIKFKKINNLWIKTDD